MPYSTTDANSILGWTFAKNAITSKDKVFIGLSSNDPEADNGAFNELSGDGYARELISQYGEKYPEKMGTPSNRQIKNVAQINWPKFTAQKIVKGIGLFTDPTGGTPYAYFSLSNTSVTVPAGAVPLFDPSMFILALSDKDEDISAT
jgi:hypothetical protein